MIRRVLKVVNRNSLRTLSTPAAAAPKPVEPVLTQVSI
jgi:hypothetical protein